MFETVEGEPYRAPGLQCPWAAMMGDTNRLDVPEVQNYRREPVEAGADMSDTLERQLRLLCCSP